MYRAEGPGWSRKKGQRRKQEEVVGRRNKEGRNAVEEEKRWGEQTK